MGAPTGKGPRKRRQRYPRATSTSRRQAAEHSTGGYRPTPTSGDGRVAYLGPDIREDQPPAVREGVTRRRLVALTGACPCGATMRRPTEDERAAGGVIRVAVEHEPDCPATDDNLVAAMGASRR